MAYPLPSSLGFSGICASLRRVALSWAMVRGGGRKRPPSLKTRDGEVVSGVKEPRLLFRATDAIFRGWATIAHPLYPSLERGVILHLHITPVLAP